MPGTSTRFLLMAIFGVSLTFALPTVYFEKTVGGGSYGGSSGEVAVDFGGVGASAGGVGASAGVGSASGASAAAFASASATSNAGAAGGGATIEKEITYGHKTIPQRTEIVAEKTFTEEPKVVNEQTVQGQAQVQRTVIEKTVIPQYVEKTIQVPSYVEKTIRVPTVVEHKVRVPVTPKVVEKTYEENAQAGASAHAGASAISGGTVQLQERPVVHVHAHKQFRRKHGFIRFRSGIRTNAAAASSASASSGAYAGSNTGYNGYNGYNNGQTSVVGYKTNIGSGVLGNIFNTALQIPVATLGAVGNLLNSLGNAGNAGASVSFNKSYRTY